MRQKKQENRLRKKRMWGIAKLKRAEELKKQGNGEKRRTKEEHERAKTKRKR